MVSATTAPAAHFPETSGQSHEAGSGCETRDAGDYRTTRCGHSRPSGCFPADPQLRAGCDKSGLRFRIPCDLRGYVPGEGPSNPDCGFAIGDLYQIKLQVSENG